MPPRRTNTCASQRVWQRLDCEVFLSQRDVVLQLVYRENRSAVSAEVGHFKAAGGPDAQYLREIAVLQPPDEIRLDEIFNLRKRVGVFPNPHSGPRVLRDLLLRGGRFDMPAHDPVDRLLAEQSVLVLIDVALLEVFEAEVGAEKSGGAILQRNAAFALKCRRPHPLIRRAVGMIDDEQAHTFHFGRLGESQNRLAVAVRSKAD